jgi:alpha-tubulin suppressor-like RCC1 family protein
MKTFYKLIGVSALLLAGLLVSKSPLQSQTISAGPTRSFAICSSNQLLGWGNGTSGTFGDGANINYSTPTALSELIDVAGVATTFTGAHALFLKSDGSCWSSGNNLYGQLGHGNTTQITKAQKISNLTDIVKVSAGNAHSVFLKKDGTVWAAGWNGNGQLGIGSGSNKSRAEQISTLSDIVDIACGNTFTLYLKNDGTVWGSGRNTEGQLGLGNNTGINAPQQMQGISNVVSIAAGFDYSLMLKNDGTVWGVGKNTSGQIGDSTFVDTNLPVQVKGVSNVVAIAAGYFHSLFVNAEGIVWACGSNQYGQLGDGGNIVPKNYRVPMANITNGAKVSAGEHHSLIVTKTGQVFAVGRNQGSQLGTGNTTNQTRPVLVNTDCTVLTSVHNPKYPQADFSIYPNPVNAWFSIQTDRPAVFDLMDFSGKVLQSMNLSGGETFGADNLMKGIYFVRNRKSGAVQKMIVQ